VTVKLVALWGTPTDVEGFEQDYASTHLPLIGTVPGLKGAVASKALDGPATEWPSSSMRTAMPLGQESVPRRDKGYSPMQVACRRPTAPSSTFWSLRSRPGSEQHHLQKRHRNRRVRLGVVHSRRYWDPKQVHR
jgi:hypothetical protein